MNELISQIGLLFYPLLLLSLLGLTLMIERLTFFLRQPKIFESADIKQLSAELEKNKHLDKQVRDELLSHQLLDVKDRFEHGLKLLRLVAMVAPMVGLLGTVLGMIDAFRVIAADTGPVSPAMLADGLWSAMLTTAYGLIIAVPCLFAAFLFARMAEKRLNAMQRHLNANSLRMAGAVLTNSAKT